MWQHNCNTTSLQGGEEWVAAHRDALSGLGAGEIPAASRQGEEASPMARAQALLALTATPRTMPCRDTERAAITSFVEESLTAGVITAQALAALL